MILSAGPPSTFNANFKVCFGGRAGSFGGCQTLAGDRLGRSGIVWETLVDFLKIEKCGISGNRSCVVLPFLFICEL